VKSGQLLPATGEIEILSRIGRGRHSQLCCCIKGRRPLARAEPQAPPRQGPGCSAKRDHQEGARRCEMPKEEVVELAHTSSHSCVAGRRFSVVASGEEPLAVWAAGPAAVAPGDVALVAISEDLYLGSLT